MLQPVEAHTAVLLRFAGCELDLERFELRRGGARQALEPQAFDVLAYLVAHHDRVVSKAELFDNVWGDRFVSESALSTRIKQARRAVGDDGRQQGVIETVHGRGFRVIADVEEVSSSAGDGRLVAALGRRLRRPTSSFVGREDELDALGTLLTDRRLLTLCGPGGVGKSRLAVELACAVRNGWAEGARILDLAELPPDTDLVGAVAAAAGVRDRAGEDLLDRLADAYADHHLLLVVDNCEHLANQVPRLVRALVEAGDGVSIIATSRSPLHVDGEQVWPVEPLPTRGGANSQAPAVRLFLDRASGLARPEWVEQLDPAAVLTVCERVAGIPLGIELAASRARHVGLSSLLEELDESAPLRSIAQRDDRHASLDGVLTWSVDRLAPSDQRFFEACAAFAGRFDSAAATSVAGDTAAPSAVTDGLARLVETSLLAVESDAGTVRYRMLTPLRALGRRRAIDSGTGAAVRGRHAAWAIDELASHDGSLRGPSAALAMAAYRELLPELHVARRTLEENRELDGLATLCRAGFWFAQEQSRTDVLAWGQSLLSDPNAPREAVAVAHASLADAEWQRGDLTAAREHAEAALASAHDVATTGIAQLVRAEVCQLEGDHAGAVALGGTLSALAEKGDDPLLATIAEVVSALSLAALGRGDDARARAAVATEIANGCGSPLAEAWAAYAQGECRIESDAETALAHLERAWSLGRAVGTRVLAGVAGLSVVSVRARQQRPDSSLAELAELAEVIDHWSMAGTTMHQWTTIRNLLQLLAARGDDEVAARLHGALIDGERGGVVSGAEAGRLSDAIAAVRRRLGSTEFIRLSGEGAVWADAEVVAQARAACLAGGDG